MGLPIFWQYPDFIFLLSDLDFIDKIAEDNNVTIHYELYSGQNDQTTLKQIGDQAVADAEL